MIARVVAQLPFREEESAKDYQQFLYLQTGIEPVVREVGGNYVVVAVLQTQNIEQARAANSLLQGLTWNERHAEVVLSQFPEGADVSGDVPITVGITPATREETEREREYRIAYRQTEAFKEAQKKYQQSTEGRAAQRRYEQSDKGKKARRRYFTSDKYKASRRRYQEKRKMGQVSCPDCGDQVRDHEVQQHVLVEGSRGLMVHITRTRRFVIYKETLASEWVGNRKVEVEV